MREVINIYCDESCHLENDKEKVMALGAVYCQESKKKEILPVYHCLCSGNRTQKKKFIERI